MFLLPSRHFVFIQIFLKIRQGVINIWKILDTSFLKHKANRTSAPEKIFPTFRYCYIGEKTCSNNLQSFLYTMINEQQILIDMKVFFGQSLYTLLKDLSKWRRIVIYREHTYCLKVLMIHYYDSLPNL